MVYLNERELFSFVKIHRKICERLSFCGSCGCRGGGGGGDGGRGSGNGCVICCVNWCWFLVTRGNEGDWCSGIVKK